MRRSLALAALVFCGCPKKAMDPPPELYGWYVQTGGDDVGVSAVDLRDDSHFGLDNAGPPSKGIWHATELTGTTRGTLWLEDDTWSVSLTDGGMSLTRRFFKTASFTRVVEDPPEALTPLLALAGEYRLDGTSSDPQLTGFELKEEGRYEGRTGVSCVRAPCPSHASGTWGSDGKTVLVLRTDGKPRRYALTVGSDGSLELRRAGPPAVYRRKP